jgi:hypothetical protein
MPFAAVHESVRVKVCGWRPHDGGAVETGARVRKPPREMLCGRRQREEGEDMAFIDSSTLM